MKGKKFTAAEKHFQEKEAKLRKHYELLLIGKEELEDRCEDLLRQISTCTAENEQLRDHRDRLLQYMDLNEADIKSACLKDKAAAETFGLLNTFCRGMRF